MTGMFRALVRDSFQQPLNTLTTATVIPRKSKPTSTMACFPPNAGHITLMDNVQPVPAPGTVDDLSGCGPCIDLVGTGKMETVDLGAVNMNDVISPSSGER
jgi:hypothetical protein